MTSSCAGLPVDDCPQRSASLLPVYAMALGTFSIGTEAFMIAPLLPEMARDFHRPVADVALLITVFALSLAASSPVLTVLTGRVGRRPLLIAAMAGFALANAVAFASTSFAGILTARVLLAAMSGLYVPNANALAGAVAGPARHGRALAIVSGGMTIAIALGLPIGAMIGHSLGWRTTFAAVGLLSAIAAVGIWLGVPAGAGADIRVPGFGERVRVAARAEIVRPLLVTIFWGIGAYSAYPFIAPYLAAVAGFGPAGVTATVTLWGLSAAVGVIAGGILNDRYGPARVIAPSLAALGLAFVLLAGLGYGPHSAATTGLAMAGVALWGFSVWSFFPAQMARLIAAAGRPAASVALSLNTSAMYLGFSIGSYAGAAILARADAPAIYFASAAAEAVALWLFSRWRTIG